MIALLLSLLLAAPQPACVARASTGLADDEFAAAQSKFVRAAVSDSLEERRVALDALLALGNADASEVLVAEYGKTAEEFRAQSENALRLRYALERRQIVLENLKLEAQRDPGVKDQFPREEEKIAALRKDLSKAEQALALLEPWREALAEGMAKSYEGLGPARRRKSEQEIWQDAKEHPAIGVRMASVELLGRVGGAATAARLHDILVESDELIAKLQGRLGQAMGDVRKMEQRMQEELAANDGRLANATAQQYDSIKAEAAQLQTSIFQLEALVEAAARAGAVALSRETGKELDKTMTKLVSALKKPKDRARIDTLRLLTRATGEEVKTRTRELLATEVDPIGIGTLIDGLTALGDQSIAPVLLARYLVHENWYVRARAAHALATLRSQAAIGVLIARLGVEEGRLRTDITQSLRSLTGQQFHSSAAIWERWWKDNEAGFVVPPLAPDKSALEEAKEASGVTFFGISTDSQRVLFVLDLSGSMKFSMTPKNNPDDDSSRPPDLPGKGESSRHDASKRDLVKALGGLKDGAVFNLVLFASDVWSWADSLATMSPDVRTQVVAFIEKSDAVGGTNIYGALERAFDMAGAKGGGQWSKPAIDTLYLLTDGRASVGVTTDPAEILAYVRERNATAGITIHTIGLSDAHDAVLLRRMAEENGGQYVGR